MLCTSLFPKQQELFDHCHTICLEEGINLPNEVLGIIVQYIGFDVDEFLQSDACSWTVLRDWGIENWLNDDGTTTKKEQLGKLMTHLGNNLLSTPQGTADGLLEAIVYLLLGENKKGAHRQHDRAAKLLQKYNRKDIFQYCVCCTAYLLDMSLNAPLWENLIFVVWTDVGLAENPTYRAGRYAKVMEIFQVFKGYQQLSRIVTLLLQ